MASHQHHHQHYSHNPPNPLRPYYIPSPPIPFDSASPDPTSALSVPGPTASNVPSSYTILQDFQDYSSDYLEAPSVGESVRAFLDQAILQYTSVLISQPFEVAKTVLQCQYVPKHEGKPKQAQPRNTTTAEEQRDSEEEEEKSSGEEDNPWTFEDVRDHAAPLL
jgi:fusion and transport protein UGO1